MFYPSPDRADILVMKWRDKGESGTKSSFENLVAASKNKSQKRHSC